MNKGTRIYCDHYDRNKSEIYLINIMKGSLALTLEFPECTENSTKILFFKEKKTNQTLNVTQMI